MKLQDLRLALDRPLPLQASNHLALWAMLDFCLSALSALSQHVQQNVHRLHAEDRAAQVQERRRRIRLRALPQHV